MSLLTVPQHIYPPHCSAALHGATSYPPDSKKEPDRRGGEKSVRGAEASQDRRCAHLPQAVDVGPHIRNLLVVGHPQTPGEKRVPAIFSNALFGRLCLWQWKNHRQYCRLISFQWSATPDQFSDNSSKSAFSAFSCLSMLLYCRSLDI